MKVYVWMPTNSLVGHASLELSDGTYISWWPNEDKNKALPLVTLKGHASSGLDEDITNEAEDITNEDEDITNKDEDVTNKGRRPTHVFTLPKKYDEKEIKKWWDEYRYSGTYILARNNCCWVVYKALTKGGAPTKYATEFFWKPEDIKNYVADL